MRTAEIIVQEYLDLGYSVESLRVLADSRSEPLRSELLALLDAVGNAEVAEVACETAPSLKDGAVFFVADDDESVAGDEPGIDFNLMSDDVPAAAEESVADVLGEMAAEESVVDVLAETDAISEETVAREAEPPAEAAVSSESSGDYLPGSVLIAAPVMDTLPATVSEGASIPEPSAATKESRRDRRRRERARKKMEKRARKERAEVLPEIVLARSEDTDTMIPATEEVAEHIEHVAEQPEALEAPAPVEQLPEPCESAAPAEEEDAVASVEETAEEPEALASPEPAEQPFADYAMIVSSGGDALRLDAYDLLAEEHDEEEIPAASENNVILFRNDLYPAEVEDGADADEEYAPPVLRMLTVADEGEPTAENAQDEAPAPADEEVLTPLARLGLLRAFVGAAEGEGGDAAEASDDHVIVSMELYEEPVDPAAALAEERAGLESEYQARLDEFAGRLLELQAVAAESEARMKETASTLETRETEIAQLQAQRTLDEEDRKGLDDELKRVRDELEDRDTQLVCFNGMREEHEKLYNEFEDLRKSYNEVVTEVMPGLQNERDELALTLDRQVDAEDKLRTSLKAARKRLAVGYSMGAAACLMLLALPVANWLRSDDDTREFATSRQQAGELRDRVELAERRNVKASETIAELERKLNLAAIELAKLEERNGELSRRGRELAAAGTNTSRPGGGTPTRASTMALQATPDGGGKLRMNEVRDPAGSIEQVYADNRSRQNNDGPQMAAGDKRSDRIQVSAVATARPAAPAGTKPPAGQQRQQPKADETLAKVRAGEGVAQVVYRVLGTRDPAVINWVIRENNIKKDRRGNPRIYPEQELRLPQQTGQTASAR